MLNTVSPFALMFMSCPNSAIQVKAKCCAPPLERMPHLLESKRRPAVQSGNQQADFHIRARLIA